jgi:hypothetical protein
MKEEIQKLIEKYEEELKWAGVDQRTDDAMHPKKFEGYSKTLEKVISDLKKLVE